MTWSLERWKNFIICVYLCSWPVPFGTRVDKPLALKVHALREAATKFGGGADVDSGDPHGWVVP